MGRSEGTSAVAGAGSWNQAEAAQIIANLQHLEGALLPMLHALQEHFGYVDRAVIPDLAKVLNLSQAEVHGTITFYHDYKTQPGGQNVLKICKAEACQSMGCDDLIDHLAHAHNLPLGGCTPNGKLAVEGVYCLGNCALGPAALVGDELMGRLDKAKIDKVVAKLSGGAA